MQITKITSGEGVYLGVSFSFTYNGKSFDIIDSDESKLTQLLDSGRISEEDYDNFGQILIDELKALSWH